MEPDDLAATVQLLGEATRYTARGDDEAADEILHDILDGVPAPAALHIAVVMLSTACTSEQQLDEIIAMATSQPEK